MADEIDDRTRVDELGTALAAHAASRAATVGARPQQDLFIRHADGSVYTRDGRLMRGPIEKLPTKQPGV